jgi:hypothetical protein
VIKTHPGIFLRAPQNSLNDSVWQPWSLEEISGCQEMATPACKMMMMMMICTVRSCLVDLSTRPPGCRAGIKNPHLA